MKTLFAIALLSFGLNSDACMLKKPVPLPSLEGGMVEFTKFKTKEPLDEKPNLLLLHYVRGGNNSDKETQVIGARLFSEDTGWHAGVLDQYWPQVEIKREITLNETGSELHQVSAKEVWWHMDSSYVLIKNGNIIAVTIISMSQSSAKACITEIEI